MAKQFAWQGVSLSLTDYWRPERITGTWDDGYLSFAGERDDHLQIRWNRAKAPKELNRRVLTYFSKLEAGARKRKEAFRSNLEMLDAGDCEFEWHAGIKGYGRIGWDAETKRVLFLERSGKGGDSFKREARSFWEGLACHASDLVPWSLFGLSVSVPHTARLHSFKALSGHITFKFGCRGLSVQAERWGFGNQLVGSKGLVNWAKAVFGNLRVEEQQEGVLLYKRMPFGKKKTVFVKHEAEHNRIISLACVHNSNYLPSENWLKCDF